MKPLPGYTYAPSYVDPDGRVWSLYEAAFDSDDGHYSVHLYALSDEHAQMQIDALKKTARFDGQVLEIYRDEKGIAKHMQANAPYQGKTA